MRRADRIGAEAGAELAKEAGALVGAPLAGAAMVLFGFPALCLLVGLACVGGLVVVAAVCARPVSPSVVRPSRPIRSPPVSRIGAVPRPLAAHIERGVADRRDDAIAHGDGHMSKRRPS